MFGEAGRRAASVLRLDDPAVRQSSSACTRPTRVRSTPPAVLLAGAGVRSRSFSLIAGRSHGKSGVSTRWLTLEHPGNLPAVIRFRRGLIVAARRCGAEGLPVHCFIARQAKSADCLMS
jgi:hypothetical protein